MKLTQENSSNTQIEGLDDDADSGWGDYPIDTVLIRNETRTIHDVLRRIEKGSFVMSPDFQRDFIWKDDKQSKLIESVLMRIPLPVFYLAEDERGRMVVVDGLQRLSTFQRFVNDKLSLKLPDQKELDKKKFSDLSPKLQNRIEDCNLILYVIDAKVPERARLDIFERVNGGIPLTRQQMRNCLYMGEATKFLKEEAGTNIFIKATGGSLDTDTMRDREFVNRFCAFKLLPLSDYKGDMDNFLAAGLKHMNGLSPHDLLQLSSKFRRGLSNNYLAFGQHAFRKFSHEDASRSIINASLWDVMSTALTDYPETIIEARARDLRSKFISLFKDASLVQAITYGPNDMKKVRYRFEVIGAALKEALDD